MGYNDDSVVKVDQEFFEPFNSRQVKVVGLSLIHILRDVQMSGRSFYRYFDAHLLQYSLNMLLVYVCPTSCCLMGYRAVILTF